MKQTLVVNLLWAVGGAAVGSLGSFFLTRYYVEKRAEELIAQELQATKVYYESKARLAGEAKEQVQSGGREWLTQDHLVSAQAKARADEEALARLRARLLGLEYGDADESEPPESVEVEYVKPSDPSLPYVITVDEFSDDHRDYDKLTLSYFEGDDTLADEHEELIPDIESVVGSDALTRFGYQSRDKNVVYVRNDRIATDFEIVRTKSSYSETVLGIRAPKKKPRKMREE